MIDAAYSRQRHQENRAALVRRRRLVIPLVAALVLIGGGCVTVWAFSTSKDGNPGVSTLAGKPSDELLETARGLEVTQQQAVDQLQIVQDQLAAQQMETKRLSEQIAAVTEKLDLLLQQSVANAAAPQAKAAARR